MGLFNFILYITIYKFQIIFDLRRIDYGYDQFWRNG